MVRLENMIFAGSQQKISKFYPYPFPTTHFPPTPLSLSHLFTSSSKSTAGSAPRHLCRWPRQTAPTLVDLPPARPPSPGEVRLSSAPPFHVTRDNDDDDGAAYG